jgi:hypothetical protein
MKKSFLFVLPILLIFSMSALAGEGSDTIGACKLMPELRYSYYEVPMVTEQGNLFNGFVYDKADQDYNAREHSAVFGLTWGVTDNLDLSTFAGARISSNLKGTQSIDFGPPLGAVDSETLLNPDEGFTCGLVIKGTFWRSPGGFYLGGGASVVYGITEFRGVSLYGEKTVGASFIEFLAIDESYIQEQNLAAVADLHAGWNFKNIGLTPYLGVEYRWNKAYIKGEDSGNNSVDITLREEKPVGVYVGLDYRIGDRLNVNLESHLINRWGGSVSVGYLFDLCGPPAPIPPVVPEPVIEPKLEPMSSK